MILETPPLLLALPIVAIIGVVGYMLVRCVWDLVCWRRQVRREREEKIRALWAQQRKLWLDKAGMN